MSSNITFVGAGAGSGKTYRVIEEIQTRLVDGKCRPNGLIATSFTIKAAHELSDRIQRSLYAIGQAALAERLHEGLIGTVHGVCKQLLTRFAFEAGICPQVAVLDEEDAKLLFIETVELAGSSADIVRLQQIADLLGKRTVKTEATNGKRLFAKLQTRLEAITFRRVISRPWRTAVAAA